MSGIEQESGSTHQVASVFDIDIIDRQICDVNGQDFVAEEYSRFKYGDGTIARKYGHMLARNLLEVEGLDINDAFITSSAYKQVPTAAHGVATRTISALSQYGRAPHGVLRVDRQVVRANDFSELSKLDRDECTLNNGLVIPEHASRDLKGRDLVLIDDIKITGSHERALSYLLRDIDVNSVTFGYVAVLRPEIAAEYPQTEHRMNHAQVTILEDLVPIINKPDFVLNARTCKFVLLQGAIDLVRIEHFAKAIAPERADELLAGMVADGYHKMTEFEEAFKLFAGTASAQRAGGFIDV